MSLDWAFITAVATVVGVIGGLVSVVFLVYEIRRNAQAIEGATVQSLMSLEVQVFGATLANAEVYLRGNAGLAGLSEVEKLQYREMVSIVMSLTYSAYVQHQQGLIDDEVWEAYVNAYEARLSGPGFLECWRITEIGYPKSFRLVMDAAAVRVAAGGTPRHRTVAVG